MEEKKFIEYAQELYANNISLRKQNDELFESRLGYIRKNGVFNKRIHTALDYIDQVIMYKPCAKEIAEELNKLIGILIGENNDN
mgnify:CR=1 FL=1